MGMAIIVHGGAGPIRSELVERAQAGCREAVQDAWHMLQEGASALDVVETAVRILEDNPLFNAGTGSCLTAAGTIEMDAGIMEGHTLRVGAVAGVERIKNPITLARRVLESPHVLLIGYGAHEFAREQGIPYCRYEDLLTERQYATWQRIHAERTAHMAQEPRIYRVDPGSLSVNADQAHQAQQFAEPPEQEEEHGTVGAVALDSLGRLAAATSTGGFAYKYPGRIGDSPLIGCGFYADEQAAISCTGHGEDFIRLMIAKRAADYVAHGMHARDAAQAAITYLGTKARGTGGLIVVDHQGNAGFAWNSQHMAFAYMTQMMSEPLTGVERS
jgi:beta-aspartyl-peptidase (threonine type)